MERARVTAVEHVAGDGRVERFIHIPEVRGAQVGEERGGEQRPDCFEYRGSVD